MEIKAELNKPYTEKERMDFIVEYNHKNGFSIEETENSLVAKGYTEEENTELEQERINMLSLTAADVERAIYKVKGMDFEDVIEMVRGLVDTSTQGEDEVAIDLKALKIELKANNFCRGNPYIDQVGKLLGFSAKQLDDFFETGDYKKLGV